MSLLRAAMFVVPLLVAALVRWWLARRDVRPGHRWLLWIPVVIDPAESLALTLGVRSRGGAAAGR